MCASDIFLGLLAIFFPPLAVWVKCGICSADSLINIALLCLGYFPGLLHAWYIISTHPDSDDDSDYQRVPQDPERASVTYYYVQQSPSLRGQPAPAGSQRGYDRRGQMGYGTLGSSPASAQPLPPSAQQQQPDQAGDNERGVPPSYQEAIQGDNKIQHD